MIYVFIWFMVITTSLMAFQVIHYLLKYYFNNGFYHGILTIQATWELFKLKLDSKKRSIEGRDKEVVQIVEVEEVLACDIPDQFKNPEWDVRYSENDNNSGYTTIIIDKTPVGIN